MIQIWASDFLHQTWLFLFKGVAPSSNQSSHGASQTPGSRHLSTSLLLTLHAQHPHTYTVLVIPHFFSFSFSFFWHVACRILLPQPGIKLMPPAMEAWCLNLNWTTREVLDSISLIPLKWMHLSTSTPPLLGQATTVSHLDTCSHPPTGFPTCILPLDNPFSIRSQGHSPST